MNIIRSSINNNFIAENIDHMSDRYTFEVSFGEYGEILEAYYFIKGKRSQIKKVPDNWNKILDRLSSIGGAYSV